MNDVKRLEWLMKVSGIEGFKNVDKDRYDYASEVAHEEGRDEPNTDDEIDGFRRCIDEAIRNNYSET